MALLPALVELDETTVSSSSSPDIKESSSPMVRKRPMATTSSPSSPTTEMRRATLVCISKIVSVGFSLIHVRSFLNDEELQVLRKIKSDDDSFINMLSWLLCFKVTSEALELKDPDAGSFDLQL